MRSTEIDLLISALSGLSGPPVDRLDLPSLIANLAAPIQPAEGVGRLASHASEVSKSTGPIQSLSDILSAVRLPGQVSNWIPSGTSYGSRLMQGGADMSSGLVDLLASPIIGGLMSLFGGGQSEPPTPLVHYLPPAPVHVEAGYQHTNPDLVPVSYDQFGEPRGSFGAAPQITIQVQSLDSRSFMDNSTNIASAVRKAMLESGILTDLSSEV